MTAVRPLSDAHPAALAAADAPDSEADLEAWLAGQAAALGLPLLLAHLDDGVVWGRLERDALVTSHGAAPEVSPPLRAATLQQARLFGDAAELFVWRTGGGEFRARLLRDVPSGDAFYRQSYDEPQLLWGTRGEDRSPGFRLWTDGAQGLRHALPTQAGSTTRPPRLRVRHYLAPDGPARVVASRLLGLDPA